MPFRGLLRESVDHVEQWLSADELKNLGTRSVRSVLQSHSDGTESAPQEVAVGLDPKPLLPFQAH